MRLLMSATPTGADWTYVLDLCRGLGEYDVDVVLATLGAPLTDHQHRDVAGIPHVVVEEGRFRFDWMSAPWTDVQETGAWLQHLARTYAVDVVHLNHLMHGHLDYGAPVLTAAHTCALSCWNAVQGTDAPWYYARYRTEVHASLAGSGAVVVTNASMARSVQQFYGPLRDVSLIRNARPPAPALSVDKAPVIFTSGRVADPAQNLTSVMRVAPSLSWAVVVAGADLEPVEITDEFASTGATCVGALTGREMARWYATASIFALPAQYEPVGLAALEAAHAGCALVLGDTPAMREMWGGAALFVPPGDDEALTIALQSLIADAPRRRRLANAARRRAASRSYDHFVREYVLAYRTLHGGYASLFEGVRHAPVA